MNHGSDIHQTEYEVRVVTSARIVLLSLISAALLSCASKPEPVVKTWSCDDVDPAHQRLADAQGAVLVHILDVDKGEGRAFRYLNWGCENYSPAAFVSIVKAEPIDRILLANPQQAYTTCIRHVAGAIGAQPLVVSPAEPGFEVLNAAQGSEEMVFRFCSTDSTIINRLNKQRSIRDMLDDLEPVEEEH